MLRTATSIILISASAFGLAACDVKKTQEGRLTAPKFEVTKKQDGEVALPKYEITPPTVTVGSTETDISLPTVKAEEKTITVPVISKGETHAIELPTIKVTPAPDTK